MKNKKPIEDCCGVKDQKDHGIAKGIIYGLFPHSFCILFILLSIIGATTGSIFLSKFLTIPYFFESLMAISFLFAAISAIIYLKKNNCLNLEGIRKKRNYLIILFGITLVANLSMFYLVFPLIAKMDNKKEVVALNESENFKNEEIEIQVEIPCSGHSFLIRSELKKLSGVKSVEFIPLNKFKVAYDPNEVGKEEILELEIFKTYKAEEI